jgi:hypothetical protein
MNISIATLLRTHGLFKNTVLTVFDFINESDLQTVSSSSGGKPSPENTNPFKLLLTPRLNDKLMALLQRLLNKDPNAKKELQLLLRENQLSINQIKDLTVALTENATKGVAIAQETLTDMINIVPATLRLMINKTIDQFCQKHSQTLDMNDTPKLRPKFG